MTVHHISLNDCLDGTSPPEKVLTLGVVDDTAFVYINAVTSEGDKAETQTVTAEIAVSLASLREALALLSNDRSREDLRATDAGGPKTRISGQRAVIAPI
ncbi:hypothetical protein [Streptomyces sp. NPDC060001]|uniref:hypothetical protein n=1 Tax=Streptomyces sp. NPDC060001 TaxID=3347032 RepID=UPI0036AC997A